ncbi:MAG: DUF1572 domain-containing protein [Bacteroidia bacterium]
MDTVSTNYLDSVRKLFRYYKSLGDKALARVTADELLHWQSNDVSNSIAIVVKHLAGNMRSRWTDFLHSDGEKPWRDREGEVTDTYISRAELMADWEAGWACLFGAIDSLDPAQTLQVIYIRNEGHTVIEAINRQLAHVPYHVGQIVYLARLLTGDSWVSLSIPRGGSQAYNQQRFDQDQQRRFFTDSMNDIPRP